MIKQLHTTGPAPCPRQGHTLTPVDHSHALLFGGRGDPPRGVRGRHLLQDVWLLSLEDGTWSPLQPSGPGPSARHNHVAVYWQGAVLVFGGATHEGYSSEVWELRPGQLPPEEPESRATATPPWNTAGPLAWRRWDFSDGSPVPAGRAGSTGILHDDTMIVFGGSTAYDGTSSRPPYLDDTWVLDLRAVTWHQPPCIRGMLPPPRNWHSATSMPLASGRCMVVYGGYLWDPETRRELYYDDIWVLSLPSTIPFAATASVVTDPAPTADHPADVTDRIADVTDRPAALAADHSAWVWARVPTGETGPGARNRHSAVCIETDIGSALAVHGGNRLFYEGPRVGDVFYADAWILPLASNPDGGYETPGWQRALPGSVRGPPYPQLAHHVALRGPASNPLRGTWLSGALGDTVTGWAASGAVLYGGEVGKRLGTLYAVIYAAR
eukprot:m.252260 g.252260  ORF g.252260 m.252260 type:complete len:439 (-) comp17683_c0_seq1:157-1473(-)